MSLSLILDRVVDRPRRADRRGGAGLYRKARSAARRARAGALAGALLAPLCGCNIYTVQQDIELGTAAFQEQVLAGGNTLTSGPQVDQAERVTARLVEAAKELDAEIATQFPWEVAVIDEPGVVNAFCLPGGKMAVYTGILPVTQTDAGLAVVMGHEIAHATQRHGTERLTRSMPIQAAISILTQNEDQAAIAEVAASLGIGLPWSRSDELEADRVGLMYMARAGYDPREAPEFWRRMAELAGGSGEGLSEFLSTHPANSTRIEQIEELLPQALTLYDGQKKQLDPGAMP